MIAASLSQVEARRLALRAQGLLGAGPWRGRTAERVTGVLHHLGAVQLDTIAVLARSHELVPYARLGPVGREPVERAFWGRGRAFEYWSHAACLLPVEQWPWFGFRRREFRARGQRWHQPSEAACGQVRAQLAGEGPLTATELGGAKAGGPWWDWSEIKVAAEWLLDVGEVVCVERRGWRRVYDLAERAIPAHLRELDPSDRECWQRLVGQAGQAMGVATLDDLADYHRLTREQVQAVVGDTALVPVEVEGWRGPAWADPGALEALGQRGRHRTTLLSPFDSLIWHRPRTKRLFGFTHALEAYTPAHKRVHGYFAMPLLGGGELLGRVDPGRDGPTLVAKRVSLETRRAVAPRAQALREAADWVGCTQVRVEAVQPAALHAPLTAATSS